MPPTLRLYKFVIPTTGLAPGRLAIALAGSRDEALQKVREYATAVHGDPSWLQHATVREYDLTVAQGIAWVETGG